jgi:hypothetical protein
MRDNQCAAKWHLAPLALFCMPCLTASREGVREFGCRRNAARAGALAFRPIAVNGLQGRSKSASTGEGTCPRSPFYHLEVHGTQAVGHGTPHRLFCRRTVAPNAIKAEASACATLRANGTAPASGYRGPRPCPVRRCASCSKVRRGFEKCASWKTPRIPSKMRTLFQGAHEKLRIFERSTVRARARVLGGKAEVSLAAARLTRSVWESCVPSGLTELIDSFASPYKIRGFALLGGESRFGRGRS